MPERTFHFPVLAEQPSSFAVFKDLTPEPDVGFVTREDRLEPAVT